MPKNPDRVCVLETNIHPLIIRANPSKEEVRGFVAEHHRRWKAGEPAGRQDLPAYLIKSAAFYKSEEDYENGGRATALDISDLLDA